MFEVGDMVTTKTRVTRDVMELLKSHNIRPGTEGEIISITLTVRFKNCVVQINEDYVDLKPCMCSKDDPNMSDQAVADILTDMFGMKK